VSAVVGQIRPAWVEEAFNSEGSGQVALSRNWIRTERRVLTWRG